MPHDRPSDQARRSSLWVSTVGKHAAADGASAHPIVAAALAARPADVHGAHSADGAGTPGESPVGWPAAPAPGDGRTGWPADADGDVEAEADPTADDPTAEAPAADAPNAPGPNTQGPNPHAPNADDPAAEPDGPATRHGWRRLFGAGRVA